MKELRIKKLSIKSWKGQTKVVELDCKDVMISGKNGVGKTTIAKAWFWLLSGYTDALNPKNHELYDNTQEITENTPMASVRADITLGGCEYSLERTAKASFSKKRGEEAYTKDASDKYTFKLDDIEVSVASFNEWIETNVCPKELTQYLLNGEFIANLSIDDKEKARKVLEYIVGDINNDDFKGDYSVLFKMLERFSIENLKEQTKQRMKMPKQRLEELPTSIENKQSDIANLESIDYSEKEKSIADINAKIKAIDEELKGGANKIKPIIEQRNNQLAEIAKLKRGLEDAESAYITAYNASLKELRVKIEDVDRTNAKIATSNKLIQDQYSDKQKELELAKKDLEAYNLRRDSLVKQRDEVKARVFEAGKCAYCGQELPIEKIEELKAKFNEQKKSDLDVIVVNGRAAKEKIDHCKEKIERLNEFLSKGITLSPLVNADELKKELAIKEAQIKPFKDTDEYCIAIKKIEALSSSIIEIPQVDNDSLTLEKSSLMKDLAELNQDLGKKAILDKYKEELRTLICEQKANSIELAKLQKLDMQIDEYIEEKANIISSRVNDLLDFAKIEMQERQKDGHMKPSATICRKDGVKYATLNNSDRILTTIDLQMMFNKYYGVSLPIFIDEASTIALNRIPEAEEWQKIYLKYEEKDFEVVPMF